MIEHEDGWPSMGLRFRPEANETQYLQTLIQASEANGHKFDVYTHETMPKRYHFSNSDRIAPIYVVPKIGYALTTYEQGTAGMSTGVRSRYITNVLLTCCILIRITGTIIWNRRCKLSSSHMAPSPRWPRPCSAQYRPPPTFSRASMRDGTRYQTLRMSSKAFRTSSYTT